MSYTAEDVLEYVAEEDVKFIRLAFLDVNGIHRNLSILPAELKKAFNFGIPIDATAIDVFHKVTGSDLLLHPDPSTLSVLPWRPEHGRVVRMYCSLTYPDGRPFECDTRSLLKKAVNDAKACGLEFIFGSEMEFYLFKLDDEGNKTFVPYDNASYLDIAPEDKGENIRREICLTLEQMDIIPLSSHHEIGPGQHAINFIHGDPITAADNAVTFKNVVETVAGRNGLWASFAPKPLKDKAGSAFRVIMSARDSKGEFPAEPIIGGLLDKIPEMMAFLNPIDDSYRRLGTSRAPLYISWSKDNRSQLIRFQNTDIANPKIILRSPDPQANPYITFALMIYAALDGLKNNTKPMDPVSFDLQDATSQEVSSLTKLPETISIAKNIMKNSFFIKDIVPEEIIRLYLEK